MENTNIATKRYNNKVEQEDIVMSDIKNVIEGYVDGSSRDKDLNDCIIDISSDGIISIRPISGITIRSFFIIRNNKYYATSLADTYFIELPYGASGNFYIIAVDENGKLYKSNTVSYTEVSVCLYNKGDKCEEITNGWGFKRDTRLGHTSVDLSTYDYMELKSWSDACTYINVYTNDMIDITGYSKIKVRLDVTESETTEEDYRAIILGIGKAQNKDLGGEPDDNFDYSTGNLKRVGNNIIIELDISSYTGDYYIGMGLNMYYANVHKIWLE